MPSLFFDGEAGFDREANGAQESESVFLKADLGIADSAQEFVSDVLLAVDVVEDFVGEGVLKKTVDGEVASAGIFFGVGEGDGFGATAIVIGTVVTEGGDLEVLSVFFYEDNAEVGAYGVGVLEEGLHLVGGRGGRDVEVFGANLEELIAHAAASEEGFVSGVEEAGGHCGGVFSEGRHTRVILRG